MRTALLVVACAVFLSGCSPKTDPPTGTSRPQQPLADPVPRAEADGTDTGGGGFADQSALDALSLAKHALAQRIENIPDSAFDPYFKEGGFYQFGLPEGKRKSWLVNVIRGIKVKRAFEERYGKPLKFNYDPAKGEVYATNYFVQNFAYGRFQSAMPKDKVRLLHEIFQDILHEVSHFYDVGLTEKTDFHSDQWARDFLTSGLDAFYACENEDYFLKINKSSGLVLALYRPTDEQRRKNRFIEDVNGVEFGYWRQFSGMFLYSQYEYLTEDYAKEIYTQYIALASMKGKADIPQYIRDDIWPRGEGFLFSEEFKKSGSFKGSAVGYPSFKAEEDKYILFWKGIHTKDLLEIDLVSLKATYNVGQRPEQEGIFVYPRETEVTLKCKDYHKPVVISAPRTDIGDVWEPYTEE